MLDIICTVATVVSAVVGLLAYIHSVRKDRQQKKWPPDQG